MRRTAMARFMELCVVCWNTARCVLATRVETLGFVVCCFGLCVLFVWCCGVVVLVVGARRVMVALFVSFGVCVSVA